MKRNTVKNPLRKRIFRELRDDWRKYLVVALFLILTIGFISGMYVANESMITSADKSVTKYKREDGHFELKNKQDDLNIDSVKIYDNFFKNVKEDNDNDGKSEGTIRVYYRNDDINRACLMDGKFPEKPDEIAIDRMHADNVGIKVGDTVKAGNSEFKVTGLIAYVNYSTLHEKTTDLIFDAIKFDVGMVTKDGFDKIDADTHYTYAWKYKDKVKDEKEEKKASDRFMKEIVKQALLNGNELTDYVPAYGNPAINFATDDMGSDKAMGGVILDILIVIIAFIFAITISNTIAKESSAIGTLRASGYTKSELVMHYISTPVIVTLLSAVIGNILGYTVFKNFVVSMYYNSYSLPEYKTIWNAYAFLKTTIIPVVLMFIVNLVVIIRMMQNTPLQFLRHDLKKKKRKNAMRLPAWKFINRFRLRIVFQNIYNYLVLFIGILFITTMLAMAVGLPETLDYYQENAEKMMLSKYQYVLKSCVDVNGNIVSTDNKEAEKFDMRSLEKKSKAITEEVSVYGVTDGSKYVKIRGLSDLKENEVYITESFSEKYNLQKGDKVTLDEKYEETRYTFKVKGIYDKYQSIAVFMPKVSYEKIFDVEDGMFSGYMSDSKIDDINSKNISTIITKRDITKMCDQLNHSMGSYMTYFQVLCIMLSAVLIYLLTKIIIEKNENSISMVKILGYQNGEIAGLYLFSTTVVVIVADVVSVILGTLLMKIAWGIMLESYNGWFGFKMEPVGYAKMFLFVLIGYLVVMFFDFRRIKKVPMDEALKNVE